MHNRPKVALVLGAGGLRGVAHIGVLKVLEEEQVPIDLLVGCSIGSMVGALYAAGIRVNMLEKIARYLERRHWLDFVVDKTGLIAGERTTAVLKLLTKEKHFAELNIPLAVVATDLHAGTEKVFTEGPVAEAVRASISVPGIFIPAVVDAVMYVDGAVLNPTPIDVARQMGGDVVIAVDLSGNSVITKVTNMFDVILRSIDIMQREILKHKLVHSDVLIQPKMENISPSAFDKINESLVLGEQAAREAMPRIRQVLVEKGVVPV